MALADILSFRQLVTKENLLVDTLSEGTEMQVLENSEEFQERTLLHKIEENSSLLGFQCKESTQKISFVVTIQKKMSVDNLVGEKIW